MKDSQQGISFHHLSFLLHVTRAGGKRGNSALTPPHYKLQNHAACCMLVICGDDLIYQL